VVGRLIAAPHKFSCGPEPNRVAAVFGVQSIGWSRALPLFPREKAKPKPLEQETQHKPLDPVALCLALWLGAMACVFGFVRLMDDAAQRTEAARHSAIVAPPYPAGSGG